MKKMFLMLNIICIFILGCGQSSTITGEPKKEEIKTVLIRASFDKNDYITVQKSITSMFIFKEDYYIVKESYNKGDKIQPLYKDEIELNRQVPYLACGDVKPAKYTIAFVRIQLSSSTWYTSSQLHSYDCTYSHTITPTPPWRQDGNWWEQ